MRESAKTEGSYIEDTNKLINKYKIYQGSPFSSKSFLNRSEAPLKKLDDKYSKKHAELLESLQELILDIQHFNDNLCKSRRI